MGEVVLEAMTRAFLDAGSSPAIFAWQGGEPTLAGIAFYRHALSVQRRLAADGQRVVNAFQTNGVLVDEDWADFLADNGFLVGLSIDGPAHSHDVMRSSAGGTPSHSLAVAAWRLLQDRGCPVNVLCVVHRENTSRAAELYHYFTTELGADHLQFIPCVEWTRSGPLRDFSLRPGEYAHFLVELFDLWAAESDRPISIKLFDDLALFLAGKLMRDCMHRAACDSHLVIERDGSVYPCDFFVGEQYHLGNISKQSILDLTQVPPARIFRDRKSRQAPLGCAECRHFDICRGGCCKFWRPSHEGSFTQYLCSDMRYFLDQRRPYLEQMARALRARWWQWGASSDT